MIQTMVINLRLSRSLRRRVEEHQRMGIRRGRHVLDLLLRGGPPLRNPNKGRSVRGVVMMLLPMILLLATTAIIVKHGLKRTQASLQLRNWKGKTYDNTQARLIFTSPAEIEEQLLDSLSEDPTGFALEVLHDLVEQTPTPGEADVTNLFQSLSHHRNFTGRRMALRHIHDTPDHGCVAILASMIKGWTKIMGEEIPELAKNLGTAELGFLQRKEEQTKIFAPLWMMLHGEIPLESGLDEEAFGNLGVFVFGCLFARWCSMTVAGDRPDIIIVQESIVAKYSLPVIYYVAGWTLQRASQALTVALGKRDKYIDFASAQHISSEAAKVAGLPYTLVELRQRKSLFFSSRGYFNFILLVESTYVKNLTLTMMKAYIEGDLISAIDAAIKKDRSMQVKFLSLFDIDANGDDGNIAEKYAYHLEIMEFVLDRYRRMRGCWFVKYLKGNQGKSIGERILDHVSTNTKVAHAAAVSRAVGAAKKEAERRMKALQDAGDDEVMCNEIEVWDKAADNVFQVDSDLESDEEKASTDEDSDDNDW